MDDLLSPAKPAITKATTPAVMIALRERYCAPEFAMFEEVGDSGSGSRVYADGVAINMWASRGYAITGFEVKVSRSDWLRELKQPDKAEPVITKCDFWYLVAPDEVYQVDEVPVNWGILAFKNGKLREARKAPKMEPKPITRAFVAQMFRRSHTKEEQDITARIAKALESDRAAINKRIEEQVNSKTRHLRERSDAWNHLLKELGESEWASSQEVIAAVKVVLKSGVASTYGGINGLLNNMRASVSNLEKAAEMFVPAND